MAALVVVTVVLTGSSEDGVGQVASADSHGTEVGPPEDWRVFDEKNAVSRYSLESHAMWLHDDAIVIVNQKFIAAYERRDGKKLWEILPPEDSYLFCGASSVPVDGQAAVAFSEGPGLETHGCRHAAVVDLRAGTYVWHNQFEAHTNWNDEYPEGAIIDIVGDSVVVAANFSVAGLDLGTGEQRWAWTAESKDGEETDCRVYGLVPDGDRALISQQCTASSDVTFLRVDPATGKTLQRADYASGSDRLRSPELINARPPTAIMSGYSTAMVANIDENLEARSLVDVGDIADPDGLWLGGFGFRPTIQARNVTDLVFDGQMMYGTTLPPAGVENEVRAYDMGSGELAWEVTVPDSRVVQVVAVDEGDLVAVVTSLDDGGPLKIARLDVTDGSVKDVTTGAAVNTKDGEPVTLAFYRYVYEDGRVYGVRGRWAAASDISPPMFATSG